MGYETEQLSDEELILRGLVIEDASADFVAYLAYYKFERVELTELSHDDLPDYALEWLGEGFDEEEFLRALLEGEGPRYWKVKTAQGTFGIYFPGFPLIDLTGTGIELEDVVSGEDVGDPRFPFFALGDEETLERFCALLTLQHDLILSEQEGE